MALGDEASGGADGKDKDDTDKRRMGDRDKRMVDSVGSGMVDVRQDEPREPPN